jgi:hypothetical protein
VARRGERCTCKDLPKMRKRESQCNYMDLSNCQSASTSLEKDIIASVNNYKILHLTIEKVIERCLLPSLRGHGSPRPMINVLNELEEIIRGKGIAIGITPKISKEALKEHIANPSKEINLINSFLSTLKRGVAPCLRN